MKRPPGLHPDFREIEPGCYIAETTEYGLLSLDYLADEGEWIASIAVARHNLFATHKDYWRALRMLRDEVEELHDQIEDELNAVTALVYPRHPCPKRTGCVGHRGHYDACETAEEYCQKQGPLACIFEPGHEGECDPERK